MKFEDELISALLLLLIPLAHSLKAAIMLIHIRICKQSEIKLNVKSIRRFGLNQWPVG